MKKMAKFVDTNIFLEVFVRDGAKAIKCLKFLENEKNLWTSVLVLSEVEWVMRDAYGANREVICERLDETLSMRNIKVEQKKTLQKAVLLYGSSKADWVDCVNYLKAKKKGIRVAISYDKHFNRFEGIERKEP